MHLRDVQPEDAPLLFEWANDPEVRRMSFSPGSIEWDAHLNWFEQKRLHPASYIYMAMEHDQAVGQIRFDLNDDRTADVDIHTSPEQRGKGLGTKLIQLGVDRLFANSDARIIRAIIRIENVKSAHAFARAGFLEVGRQSVHDQPCLVMIKARIQ